MKNLQFLLIFAMIACLTARRLERQTRETSMFADDDMVFVGNYQQYNSLSFSSHFIHDIFDETMFYEFLQSNRAVTKRNIESFINRTVGNFGRLSDEQFDTIINKWIFQMLPGGP